MQYDLVFEGGGAKGMVFVGAMEEFEAREHTSKRLLGTSAGAITAALLAAGYTAAEMRAALGEQENGHSVFNGFMARPGPFGKSQVLAGATLAYLQETNLKWLPDFIEDRFEVQLVEWLANNPKMSSLYSLLEYGGWFSATNFVQWLRRRLDTGSNQGKPRRYSALTLEQFYAETGRELTVIASDTSGGALLALNHRTAPQLPLVWAVRMSMSIPLLWQEVVWQAEWGGYRGNPIAGHAIVDGGLLSNFPIELFISQAQYVKDLMGPAAGEAVLGMRIDESLAVEGQPEAPPAQGKGLGDAPLLVRLSNLMNTTLSARDKLVSEGVARMVVHLPAKGYGTTEFDMSDEKRERLVHAGRAALKTYFDDLELQAAQAGGVSFDPAALEEQIRAEERLQAHADAVALRIFGP